MTETLFELGAGDCVAGVTDFCIFPEGATRLPHVGGTKNPRIDFIRELAPDLVHMNLEENLAQHAAAIGEFCPVYVTAPAKVGDVPPMLREIGRLHDRESAAEAIASDIERLLSEPPAARFTFACPIWQSPWMWCGGDTYVSSLLESSGGTNVLSGERRYPKRTLPEIVELDPDLIVLPDEPFLFTDEDAATLRSIGSWRVVGPFSGHLVTWHGVRTLAGLREMRRLLTF